MSGLAILALAIGIPYVMLNLRRLAQGRRWAFTFCQAAREWEEQERARARHD